KRLSADDSVDSHVKVGHCQTLIPNPRKKRGFLFVSIPGCLERCRSETHPANDCGFGRRPFDIGDILSARRRCSRRKNLVVPVIFNYDGLFRMCRGVRLVDIIPVMRNMRKKKSECCSAYV
ncbi:hypothetical protein ACLD9W_12445, partial [Neisseria sp. WLZKY-1]|uniref:hypothetical protein n=1 Tax=Neisseria sp. WLZKY-1 TaxID=3390377 RepID=UPI00397937F0